MRDVIKKHKEWLQFYYKNTCAFSIAVLKLQLSHKATQLTSWHIEQKTINEKFF